MDCNRAQNLIDAYIDNELDPIHAAEFDVHLRDCPACKSLLHRRRALQQALRTHLPYFQAPSELRRALAQESPATKPVGHFFRLAAAAAILIVVAGLSALTALSFVHTNSPTTQSPLALISDAIESAHLRSLQPDHLLDVISTDQHTVKPWFTGKIDFAPPVRDLAAAGFPLIGGRLDIINQHPAAALIYHCGQHTINLFLWPTTAADRPAPTPESFTTPRGYHLLHWTDGSLTYWAISDVEPAQLDQFAALQQQK